MGRFTQPDPIGLAGGLNLYGYAGGDPVNNSDPFGLCPRTGERKSCAIHRATIAGLGGLIGGAVYGGTGGTLVLPGVGTAVGATGGALAGLVAGVVAGAVVGGAEDLGALAPALERRIVLIGSLIGGLISGKAGDYHKAIRDVIRAEQEAARTRKQADEERKAREKEKEAGGEPPPRDPEGGDEESSE